MSTTHLPLDRTALRIATALVTLTHRNGGVTLRAGGTTTNLTDGYMVGGRRTSRLSADLPDEALIAMAAGWVAGVQQDLGKGDYLGAWRDKDGIWLDVSRVYARESEALLVALRRGELAIWDNGAECAIDATPANHSAAAIAGR